MVTYADLFQFCMLIVALVGLCHQIYKDKSQPPVKQVVRLAGYKPLTPDSV